MQKIFSEERKPQIYNLFYAVKEQLGNSFKGKSPVTLNC
jgi:hypothetical protein